MIILTLLRQQHTIKIGGLSDGKIFTEKSLYL